MIRKHLGEQINIHGGGMDLIFPHHENEIAQSEGCSGKIFVKYWIHNNMLNLGGAKMSKSLGNIRLYVGNGGVNLISSFHIIGEIFDKVYPEAAMGEGSSIFKNIQTTAVLPGGATIVEFTVDVPGKYLIVDHALARMNKGAWAILEVTGPENPEIFAPVSTVNKSSHSQM
jgi:hypothetical protein